MENNQKLFHLPPLSLQQCLQGWPRGCPVLTRIPGRHAVAATELAAGERIVTRVMECLRLLRTAMLCTPITRAVAEGGRGKVLAMRGARLGLRGVLVLPPVPKHSLAAEGWRLVDVCSARCSRY